MVEVKDLAKRQLQELRSEVMTLIPKWWAGFMEMVRNYLIWIMGFEERA